MPQAAGAAYLAVDRLVCLWALSRSRVPVAQAPLGSPRHPRESLQAHAGTHKLGVMASRTTCSDRGGGLISWSHLYCEGISEGLLYECFR